jgi:cholesterol oxidase
MQRLSSSIHQIKNHYSVVVVGSGYGGGITASRVARAGKDVCVLERGREYIPGEYPNTQAEVIRETQVDLPEGHIGSHAGLLDFRVNKDINVLVGCGLGGTSLINAGVAVQPDPRVFDDPRWPSAFRQDKGTRLADGFTHATAMLQPSTYPDHFPPIHKLDELEASAKGINGKFYRLPINVTFTDGPNPFGVEQNACVGCGDCVTGCNYGAKNTTLMNYLPDARNHGAEIYTEVSVRHLERKNNRWLVHYQVVEAGQEKFNAPLLFVSADVVVLAAGTLGSTEILLRSRAAGLGASDKIGRHFTGNGDVLGFSYNSNHNVNGFGFGPDSPASRNPVGPCITGIIDLRKTPVLEDGMVIEEGSIPGAIAGLMPLMLSSTAARLGKDTNTKPADQLAAKLRETETLFAGPFHGATQNTQTYLVMTHDDGEGRMFLNKDRLRIDWPGVGSQPIFEKVNQRLLDVTKPIGGTYVPNPTWSKLTNQNLTSVHPLGGCVMAESADHGVVNHKGQVFSGNSGTDVHDGLLISDGSILPRPLGVNPLLTISAIAERNCALLAEDRGWKIDYKLGPPPAPPVPKTLKPGVRFTETMKGFFSTAVKDDFQKGSDQGKKDGSSLMFVLTIGTDDAEFMLTDSKHLSQALGTVTAPALSAKPLNVRHGTFQLFVDDPTRVETKNMIYRLVLDSEDGHTYFFNGVKLVHDDHAADLWNDTTTLFVTLYDGPDDQGAVLGKGILKIQPQDFAVQMGTMQVFNVDNDQERLRWLVRVGQFFTGSLFETYGPVAAKTNRIDPTQPPARKKRPLRMAPPELYYPVTSDNVQLRLTRYRGGAKGPVMMSPGFGVSTMSFSTDTVDTNLPEYLYARGYDVWLFDYRASPDLPSAATQFSLDDIAQKDYPAAVAKVLEITGAQSVQMIAHCVGSMTFLMSMMSGLSGVRSAICSQLGLFPVTSTFNQVKAGLNAPGFLLALGQKTVDTNLPPSDWRNILADVVIQMFPPKELCRSSVCHQVRIIYGESYKHDQLNAATHDALYEMFGVSNIRTFAHILKAIQIGNVVDEKGNDIYMPNVARLKIPITFIQGADNELFLPAGTHKTFLHLCAKNGADGYELETFAHYGHMDCFVGKTAVTDIYPTIAAHLDVQNPAERSVPGSVPPADTTSAKSSSRNPALNALFNYPLMSAITDRRTRRVARGTSLLSAGLSYTSPNPPQPLSPLEEAILVVTSGLVGQQTMHDGPLQIPGGGNECGTPFMNILSRSASSPDNSQATVFFMINDEGTWLLKRLSGAEGLAMLNQLPPKWVDWSDNDWLAAAAAVKLKLYDQRVEFPREFPYYLGWNKQISNRPGTTIFFPVVDCTRAYINIILYLLSERDGQRPLFIDDWQCFKPADAMEAIAWAAIHIGLIDKQLPYQPVGGIARANDGWVNPNMYVPLGLETSMRIPYEAFFLLQNLMLVGHGIGLGGWVHSSIAPPFIFERDPSKGWMGLGFRMQTPNKKWATWPPLPSTLPNPVGIDGILEGLCPPYVASLDAAVDQVLAEKYTGAGPYSDLDVFKRSYNSQAHAEDYLKNATHYSPETVKYTKEICNYIWDTYGRFPAHTDAFHAPGIWLQFSHLEMEYYEKFYNPELFARQQQHRDMWGEK